MNTRSYLHSNPPPSVWVVVSITTEYTVQHSRRTGREQSRVADVLENLVSPSAASSGTGPCMTSIRTASQQ